jgi:hypothetical protein
MSVPHNSPIIFELLNKHFQSNQYLFIKTNMIKETQHFLKLLLLHSVSQTKVYFLMLDQLMLPDSNHRHNCPKSGR